MEVLLIVFLIVVFVAGCVFGGIQIYLRFILNSVGYWESRLAWARKNVAAEEANAEQKVALLKTYWTIPDRQIETSVVLANPPLEKG